MTSTAIQTEVTAIITAARADMPKGGRKQYPAAKHQITSLTELNLIEYMPRGFGYQDAVTVIEAARAAGGQVQSIEGDTTNQKPSALYVLLNPAPVVVEAAQGVTVYVREDENGFKVSLVLANGFETEEVGNFGTHEQAYRVGVDWSHEDWSEYA